MRARALGAGIIVALGIAAIAAHIKNGYFHRDGTSEAKRAEPLQNAAPQAGTAATAEVRDHLQTALVPVPVLPQPPPYAAMQVDVTFPDAESIPVVVRRPMVANPPYMPTEHFLEQYDALVARARAGDAAAARMIFRALSNCQRSIGGGDDYVRTYCEGVDDDYFRDIASWARMASDGGDPLGRQDWAFELQRLGRGEESVKQLQAIWQDGYIGVLQALASAYRKGLASNGAPDYSNAYTYFYIRYKLAEAGGGDTPSQRGRLAAMEQVRRELGSFLNPTEQQRAEAKAMKLFRENTACCLGTL